MIYKSVWLGNWSSGIKYPTTLGDSLGIPIYWAIGILKMTSSMENSPIP